MKGPALTDFDRAVLSALLACGGWNASTQARLAALAKSHGVSATGLARVLAGLASAARDGRLQRALEAMGDPRAAAREPPGRGGTAAPRRTAPATPPTELAAPAGLSRSDAILLGVVIGLLVVSVALAILLAVMVWGGISASNARAADRAAAARGAAGEASDTGAGARDSRAERPDGERDSDAPRARGGADANLAAVTAPDGTGRDASRPAPAPGSGGAAGSAPRAAPGPATGDRADRAPATVPVSYPRVPGFNATLASLELDQALAQARGAAFQLESLANEAPDDRNALRAWAEAQRAVARAWPRLDAVTRRAILERSMSLLRRADDAETAQALIEPLRADLAGPARSPAALWRGAWAAGVLGSLLSEPGLSSEVIPVIAGLRLTPAEGSGDAFDRFAAAWLDQQLGPLADQVLSGAPQDDFDRFEAWIQAQSALRPQAELQDAWLRAIDALLRRPLRFDLPGTAPDLLGRFASMTEWKAGSPSAAMISRRFRLWLNDGAIAAPRLWSLGSILHQGRFAGWFDATMIVPERAGAAERQAVARAIDAAIGADRDASPTLSRIPREFVERWNGLASKARSTDDAARLVAPGVTAAALLAGDAPPPSSVALAGADALVRLAELAGAGSLLLAGRSAEAAQRLSSIENGLERPQLAGLGPGGRSLTAPVEPSGDGLLARRLDEVRTPQERIEIIRRRRTEAAPDLGPLDAARLVREAYLGEPSALRLTAQGVIVDSFAGGRRVAQELVDQFALTGGADAALAKFVERLTGERLPPHPNPAFRGKALAALLRHRLRLSEHPWHGVDALMTRMAAAEAERLEAEGGSAETLRDAADPGPAIDALGELLRQRAGTRIVMQPFPDSLAALDRRDETRRSLADGAGQRLVASLWRVLELEAYLVAADRPSMLPSLREVLARAQTESTGARGAIDQACAVQRARLAILAARLAADSGGAS